MKIFGYVFTTYIEEIENVKYIIKLRQSGFRTRYKVYFKNPDDHSRWRKELMFTGYWYKSNIPMINHIKEQILQDVVLNIG